MRRPNRATVTDNGLGAAFTEGVNEGFRLTGYVLLSVTVGGNEIVHEVIKASAVVDRVADIFNSFRGEHYQAGVVLRIMAADAPKPAEDKPQARVVAPPEIGESGIEDAEIIDG